MTDKDKREAFAEFQKKLVAAQTAAIERLDGKEEVLNDDQKELTQIYKDIKKDPLGVLSFGSDGVIRSWDIDRNVVDAVALPPRLVKADVDRWPWSQEMEDKYRGVDGTKTPREQWFNPPKDQIPSLFTEEEKTKMRLEYEEMRPEIEERMRKFESGELKRCCGGARVLSDYNLDPKP